MKNLILLMTIAISSSVFADEIKTYNECYYKAHDFTEDSSGSHIFNCNDKELSFRSSYASSGELENLFKDHLLRGNGGWSHSLHSLITATNSFGFESIIGFRAQEIVEIQHIVFEKESREIKDLAGNLIMTLTRAELEGAIETDRYLTLSNRIYTGAHHRVIVHTRKNGGFRSSTITTRENCYPKSCGTTTIVTLGGNSVN